MILGSYSRCSGIKCAEISLLAVFSLILLLFIVLSYNKADIMHKSGINSIEEDGVCLCYNLFLLFIVGSCTTKYLLGVEFL
jgi:hypothetical protein